MADPARARQPDFAHERLTMPAMTPERMWLHGLEVALPTQESIAAQLERHPNAARKMEIVRQAKEAFVKTRSDGFRRLPERFHGPLDQPPGDKDARYRGQDGLDDWALMGRQAEGHRYSVVKASRSAEKTGVWTPRAETFELFQKKELPIFPGDAFQVDGDEGREIWRVEKPNNDQTVDVVCTYLVHDQERKSKRTVPMKEMQQLLRRERVKQEHAYSASKQLHEQLAELDRTHKAEQRRRELAQQQLDREHQMHVESQVDSLLEERAPTPDDIRNARRVLTEAKQNLDRLAHATVPNEVGRGVDLDRLARAFEETNKKRRQDLELRAYQAENLIFRAELATRRLTPRLEVGQKVLSDRKPGLEQYGVVIRYDEATDSYVVTDTFPATIGDPTRVVGREQLELLQGDLGRQRIDRGRLFLMKTDAGFKTATVLEDMGGQVRIGISSPDGGVPAVRVAQKIDVIGSLASSAEVADWLSVSVEQKNKIGQNKIRIRQIRQEQSRRP